MIQLETWLRMYGRKVQDEFWSIQKYDRVRELLNIWDGPFKETDQHFLVCIEFDGDLIIRSEREAEIILKEFGTMPLGKSKTLKKWNLNLRDLELEPFLIYL